MCCDSTYAIVTLTVQSRSDERLRCIACGVYDLRMQELATGLATDACNVQKTIQKFRSRRSGLHTPVNGTKHCQLHSHHMGRREQRLPWRLYLGCIGDCKCQDLGASQDGISMRRLRIAAWKQVLDGGAYFLIPPACVQSLVDCTPEN